jgi:anthranilate phosphoribosyltransferase
MKNLNYYNNQLGKSESFTYQDGLKIMASLFSNEETDQAKREFLLNFKVKPTMDNVLLGFIAYLKAHMVAIPNISGAIDVCGTGGDLGWHL